MRFQEGFAGFLKVAQLSQLALKHRLAVAGMSAHQLWLLDIDRVS